MSKKKRFGVSQALTRGLSETINVVENTSQVFRNTILPLSRIELDPDNPRKLAITLEDVRVGLNKNDPLYAQKSSELEKLKELAATIESSGVINPIVAYKLGESYRVVAGERRCLASILAKKNEIEARVFSEKPKGFELKLIQWIENTAREDLTLGERIGNIEDLLVEYQHQHGKQTPSATLLKSMTGLSLPQATYYLAVMQGPEELKKAIQAGHIKSLDKAALIAGVTDTVPRQTALEACINGCSLKELRKIISREKQFNQPKPSSPRKTRGRVASRINMGSTTNRQVVQTIVTTLVNHVDLKKHATHFSQVSWNNYGQVTRAFRKLIEILEQEVVDQHE